MNMGKTRLAVLALCLRWGSAAPAEESLTLPSAGRKLVRAELRSPSAAGALDVSGGESAALLDQAEVDVHSHAEALTSEQSALLAGRVRKLEAELEAAHAEIRRLKASAAAAGGATASTQQAQGKHEVALSSTDSERDGVLPIITERVCRAFVYAKAVLYRDAGAGTNECPIGYMFINSRYDCRLAASALYPHAIDKTRTAMSSPDVPKGCHLEFPTGNVYLNEHKDGASTNDHNLLCKAVYADAGSNTNSCPHGYEPFIGMDMCTTAASALYPGQIDSIEFGSYEGHPGGCVYRHTTKSLLINSHKGKASWDSNLLCRTTSKMYHTTMGDEPLNASELMTGGR